jgi:thioredoxin 1
MRAAALYMLAAVAAVALLVCGCGGDATQTADESARARSDLAETGGAAADSAAAGVGSGEAETPGIVGSNGLPVLMDLGADKCVPCKMMAPIIDEMRETFAGRLDVRFVDVWKDAAAAREHDVKVIPTQIFFDEHGKELFRHQGFFSREDMLEKWAELGYDFGEQRE